MKRVSWATIMRRSGGRVESINAGDRKGMGKATCPLDFTGYSAKDVGAQGSGFRRAGARPARPPLEVGGAAGLARFLRLVHFQQMERDPLLQPRRHRRQSSDRAGAGAASGPRLV